MTSPNGFNPEGAYVSGGSGQSGLSDLNDLTEGVAKARMQGALVPSFNNHRNSVWDTFNNVAASVANVFNTFFGRFFTSPVTVVEVVDGQLEIQDRVDLMGQVSGYCRTYQSARWNVAGSKTQIPMDARLGPSKNAHEGDGGIYLDAPGTWRIDAQITSTTGIIVGNSHLWSQLYIEVYDPSNALYSRQRVDGVLRSNRDITILANTTVVIPDPGYHVRVYWAHAATRWSLYGGTHRSLLSVNRWDIDTGNFFRDEDVPNGGDLG